MLTNYLPTQQKPKQMLINKWKQKRAQLKNTIPSLPFKKSELTEKTECGISDTGK